MSNNTTFNNEEQYPQNLFSIILSSIAGNMLPQCPAVWQPPSFYPNPFGDGGEEDETAAAMTTPMAIVTDVVKWIAYLYIFALVIQYQSFVFTKAQTKQYDAWIEKHKKRIFDIQGFVVYSVLYVFQGAAYTDPDTAAADSIDGSNSLGRNYTIELCLYCTMIPLGWLVFDGGQTTAHTRAKILGSCHHMGVLLILPYHIYEHPSIASRTSLLFGWLWFAHAFSFLHRVWSKLMTMTTHTKDGENEKDKDPQQKSTGGTSTQKIKSNWGERLRELYAILTVSWIYKYYFATGQPGFGSNYQTIALTIMLTGRFLSCHAWVPWIRYAEVPGSILVYTIGIIGRWRGEGGDSGPTNSTTILYGFLGTVLLYTGALAYHVLWQATSKHRPSHWDPKHPEIKKLLSLYETKFHAEYPSGILPSMEESPSTSVKSMEAQLATKSASWKEQYPIVLAIGSNDVQQLTAIIHDNKYNCVHTKVESSIVYTPIWLAAYLGRVQCFLVLLQAGADPWDSSVLSSVWQYAYTENITCLLELQAELEPIAVKAYPPKQEPLLQRCIKCITEF